MVYNRYLELENMVNQFKLSEGISNVDGQPKLRLKDALQLSRSPAGSGGGFCCSDDFETAKMLIHSVSEVLSQMQSTLRLLEKRIEQLTPGFCHNTHQPYSDMFGG